MTFTSYISRIIHNLVLYSIASFLMTFFINFTCNVQYGS